MFNRPTTHEITDSAFNYLPLDLRCQTAALYAACQLRLYAVHQAPPSALRAATFPFLARSGEDLGRASTHLLFSSLLFSSLNLLRASAPLRETKILRHRHKTKFYARAANRLLPL
jgi:hypothetical protein